MRLVKLQRRQGRTSCGGGVESAAVVVQDGRSRAQALSCADTRTSTCGSTAGCGEGKPAISMHSALT
jgi:hypothetical protein